MSVRVRSQLIVVASLDSGEIQCQFSRNNKALDGVVETFDVESSGQIELGASEANYALPLGKVLTGRVLYLESDQELVVKLDGEVAGHTIGAPSTGYKAKLFLRSTFTAAPTLTNATTTPAVVSFFLAGDKTQCVSES
jgi:hypothetical protein